MKKIRTTIINNKLIEKLILVLLVIQPLLDFYFLFKENAVTLFGFSPSTLIRIGIMGIIGLMFLLVLKNKKEKMWYFFYAFLVVGYAIAHHINALHFTDFYGGYDFGYNLISELFYIIRMLLPLALIVISAHFEFEDSKIEKIVWCLIMLICGSIVITNLLGVSIGSYSHVTIEGNIFCWFKADRCNLNYYSLASKGFFNDPNRLAALLTLLTPLVFYILIKNPKIRNGILVVVTMLGMYMLGTKVSTYGFAILSILSFLGYCFFTIIKKELKYKHQLGIFILSVVLIALFMIPYSPALNRSLVETQSINDYNANVGDKLSENKTNMDKLNDKIKEKYNEINNAGKADDKTIQELLAELKKEDKEAKDKLLIEFIEDNYLSYNINPQFIVDSYSYKLDPDFWYDVMNMGLAERTNFRLVEELMLKRIKTINNNKWDDWLGITFTREGNIFDLERDFISHYYTLGIIGLLLLLMPYIIIVIVCGIKILLNMKELLTLKNTMYLLGIGIALFAAFYSGNVMDGLVVTLILGFVIGQLINSVFKIGNAIGEEK